MTDDRIKHVYAMVEATHFEQLCLWEKYSDQSNYTNTRFPVKKMKWESDASGYMTTLGHEEDGRPTVVSVFFAIVDDVPMCFYEATSLFANHEKVREWSRQYGKAHVDAANFRNAFPVTPSLSAEYRKAAKRTRE